MKIVGLFGTCNNSTWRDDLIKMLKVSYFNPVVDNWTEACQVEEIKQRQSCRYCLYVITPKMTGVYSIAEVVDDSNKRPEKTIFCVFKTDGDLEFNDSQIKSFESVKKMVKQNGATVLESLKDIADYINKNG